MLLSISAVFCRFHSDDAWSVCLCLAPPLGGITSGVRRVAAAAQGPLFCVVTVCLFIHLSMALRLRPRLGCCTWCRSEHWAAVSFLTVSLFIFVCEPRNGIAGSRASPGFGSFEEPQGEPGRIRRVPRPSHPGAAVGLPSVCVPARGGRRRVRSRRGQASVTFALTWPSLSRSGRLTPAVPCL